MNYNRKQWDRRKKNLIAKELQNAKYRPQIKPNQKKVTPRNWELDKELNLED